MQTQQGLSLPGVARIVESKDRDRTPVRTLYVDTRHIDACAEIWNAGGFAQLGLSAYQNAFEDDGVEWLNRFKDVRRIHICLQRKIDLTPIAKCCPQLEHFFANDGLNAIQDFRPFLSLQSIGQGWSPGQIFPPQMEQLKSLALVGFRPECGSLLGLPQAPQLAFLSVLRTSIESLNGAEGYPLLDELAAGNAPKLVNADALCQMPVLRTLSFEACRRLDALDLAVTGSNISKLNITGCGPLGSIHFIRKLPKLESFVFMDTNVIDGDLAALLDHPALRHVAFTKKAHFTHSEKDVLSVLAARRAATNPPLETATHHQCAGDFR